MLTSRWIGNALVLLVLTIAMPAQAIVIRHDTKDSDYVDLGKGFPMVCRLAAGHGTLIDLQWVLTAAHVAEGLAPGQSVGIFGDREVVVARTFVHPDYGFVEKHRDIGLVQLAEPVTDIVPARLYQGDDEVGMRVTFVGDGDTGTGKSGSAKGERIRRGAHNRVTTAADGWLSMRFDAPPRGERLEGSSGPGDSGSPALAEIDEELYVLGVSAYSDGDHKSRYGSSDMYCRVSEAMPWIEGVMTGKHEAPQRAKVMHYQENEHGQMTLRAEEPKPVEVAKSAHARLWEVVEQLTESVHTNRVELYMELMSERLVAARAPRDPLEGMHEFLVGVVGVSGPITTYHPVKTSGYEVPDSRFPMQPVMFHLEDGKSGYFGVALDETGKIDHLSVFVRNGLCDQGVACKRAAPLSEAREM